MILPHMSTLPISGRRNKSGWLCPPVIRIIPKDTTPTAPMHRILLTQQLVLLDGGREACLGCERC